MNNSTLTRFDTEDGIEILIDKLTGESFCSLKGYARMAGKDKSTISRRLEGSVYGEQNTAQAPTPEGLQRVVLITEDQIVEWLPKDNPIAASVLLKLGVRMALHAMVGFDFQASGASAESPAFADLKAKAALAIELASVPGAAAIFERLLRTSLPVMHPAIPNGQPIMPQTVMGEVYGDPAPDDRIVKLRQRILAISMEEGFINTARARYRISSKIHADVTEIRNAFMSLAAEGKGELRDSGCYLGFRAFGAKSPKSKAARRRPITNEDARQTALREGIFKLARLHGLVTTSAG